MSDITEEDAAIEKQNWLLNKRNDPNFVAELNKMTPQQQDEYTDNLYRSYVGENELANEELMTAETLRNSPRAEGRTTGGVYVAANPLEHIGDVYGDYQAKGMRDNARLQKEDMNKAQQAGLTTTANLIQDANNTVEQANTAQTQQQALAQAMQNSENDKIAAALRSGQRYTR
jgi:hypothetical protein